MELTGMVVKRAFAPASKSAHEAMILVTDQGEFKLEREEGNPFHDPELMALVGRRITCAGTLIGYVFRIRQWRFAE